MPTMLLEKGRRQFQALQLMCRVYQMGSCVNNPKYFKHSKYFFKTVKVVSSQSFNIFQASAT